MQDYETRILKRAKMTPRAGFRLALAGRGWHGEGGVVVNGADTERKCMASRESLDGVRKQAGHRERASLRPAAVHAPHSSVRFRHERWLPFPACGW